MDCSCTVPFWQEDSDHAFPEKEVTARKAHQCSECGRGIVKGERYQIDKVLYDGEIGTFKICLDCISIRGQFFAEGWFYGMIVEYLGEHLREIRGEVSSDCIRALTPRARGMVCDMIEEVWKK